MDNLGKNWQLINILFCGYQRRLEIGDWRSTKCAETYTRPGHRVPQRVNRPDTNLNKSPCRYNRITVVNLIGLLDKRFFKSVI